jgi:hypothetical protein
VDASVAKNRTSRATWAAVKSSKMSEKGGEEYHFASDPKVQVYRHSRFGNDDSLYHVFVPMAL